MNNSEFKCDHCSASLGTLTDVENSQHPCFTTSSVEADLENMLLYGREEISNSEEFAEEDVSTESTENVNTIKTDKSDKFVWTEENIRLLIEAYKDLNYKFNSPMHNKKSVWDAIAQQIGKRDHITGGVCDQKWRNLKKTYDKTLKLKKSTGSANSYWKYFDDFHEIYFKDPKFSPTCTTSSSSPNLKRSSPCHEKLEDSRRDEPSSSHGINKRYKLMMDIEAARQKRHDEKLKLKSEMFEWFRENFKTKY